MGIERTSTGERPKSPLLELVRKRAVSVLTERVRGYGRVNFRFEVLEMGNLDTLRELLAEKKTVTAVLDHRSYADVMTGGCAGVLEQFDDLVRQAHIVLKMSYAEKFPESLLVQYFNFIPVVPHTMKDHPTRDRINAAAIEKAQNMPGGSLLVIAPQGERSEEVSLGEVRRGAERFWHGNGESERWVLPIAIEGTEKQWPKKRVGGVVPTILYYWVGGRLIHKARFIFGGPFPVSKVDALAARMAGSPEEEARLRTELVMAEVARLHIEKGNPEYAGDYYKRLLEEVDKREREAAAVG